MAKRNVIEGKLIGNERGYAFLVPNPPQNNGEDFFIPHSDLKGAMHGDVVLAETTFGSGHRTTARVLKVLQRGVKEVVGTYFTCRTGGFVTPDDKKYFTDIFVPFDKGKRAQAGDKVVCKILSYPKKKNPEGMITQILGRQFERRAEVRSIMYSYHLPESFDQQVLAYADSVNKPVSQNDIKDREDLRNLLTFTIDGEDARDFDDAVSAEILSDGNVRLGVHIADVSHYVKYRSPLDMEAYNRATSVYFPEKVIPMLPEVLSNGICSLNEGVDRLTLSCIMTVDKKGDVIDRKITSSVIRSSARMTYTNVQKILDGDEKLIKQYEHLVPTLKIMDELCDLLISVRDKEGNVDLDIKESQITVDSAGEISISPALRDKAHRIIEEFMILANCTVAEYMYYLDLPFIYRVHGKPTEDRLQNFYAFLDGLGLKVKRKKDEVFPKDFQKILKDCENTPYFSLVNRVMLRSMQKAKYSPDDMGHFGLSAKHYCHFTSPIRRYPDLCIHRIIKDLLRGKNNIEQTYSKFVEDASVQSSEMERNAQEAERAVDDYYKILYISNYEGCEFDGIISGVTGFGLFVELENGVEGLVKIETLKGKRYVYDERRYTLSDNVTQYKLGQKVRILVVGVNIINRRAEFVLLDGEESKLSKNERANVKKSIQKGKTRR